MKEYDVVVKNGKIADGTGERELFAADIAIKNGVIARIGELGEYSAVKEIDAQNHVVTPGFIDMHSHGDITLMLRRTDAHNMLEQGITTELGGHCGIAVTPDYPDGYLSLLPEEKRAKAQKIFRDFDSALPYVESLQMGTNMALLVAHGAVRAAVMGYADTEPTAGQLEQMKALVRQGMERGCFGLSTGLIYPPGVYSKTGEIIELARVAGVYNGLYASHIRNESSEVAEAVGECIKIGREAGNVPTLVSHHKVCGMKNAGLSERTLKLIEQANAVGQTVRADQYPFLASSTGLVNSIHPRYLTDGPSAFAARLAENPDMHDEVIDSFACESDEYENIFPSAGYDGCLVCGADNTPQFVGMTISEIAAANSTDAPHTVIDLLIKNMGNVRMAYFEICESDMDRIIAHPFVMAGTDSYHRNHEDPDEVGGGHPRGTSTFVRHLRLVRERGLFPVHRAIHRITGMPAGLLGLSDRGRIAEGMAADICVIDWENLRDNADFLHPNRRNKGIRAVLVNGVIAAENCVATGRLAGRLLVRK